jgi:hypothetical protein
MVLVYMYKTLVQTKKQNCLQKLCKEEDLEMSRIELLDYKIVFVCL